VTSFFAHTLACSRIDSKLTIEGCVVVFSSVSEKRKVRFVDDDGADGAADESVSAVGSEGADDVGRHDVDGNDWNAVDAAGTETADTSSNDTRPVVKGESQRKLKARVASMKQRGVVYVGHVPSKMQPIQIRQLLAAYGTVTRVFFKPQKLLRKSERSLSDSAARKLQKKRLANLKFTDGWVEFADKRIAKLVAEQLNMTPMGVGRQRNKPWAGNLWVLKYLSKVRWEHLTDKFEVEAITRIKRVRSEMAEAKKDIGALTRDLAHQKRRRHDALGGDDDNDAVGAPEDDDEIVRDEEDFAQQLVRHRAEVAALRTTTEPSRELLDTVRDSSAMTLVPDDLLKML
jgi:ESF2/ABP1 family protein